MIYHQNRKGSILVIAVIFTFCMFILFGALAFRQTSTASHNQISLLDKQAFFAARSAMQHFLLKAKLFPTELYDAVEISQGKNPLFNFTEFPSQDDDGEDQFESYMGRPNVYVKKGRSEVDSKGKPRYFYVKLPNKNTFVRLASYNNPDYRFLAPNLAVSNQDQKYTDPQAPDSSYNASKYLSYYFRDCTNNKIDNTSLQPSLEMIKANNIKKLNDFDIATSDGYPYTLSYNVVDVKIKAIQGMKKYGEEAIEIVVEGSATNFQNKESKQRQTKTQKITREGSVDR